MYRSNSRRLWDSSMLSCCSCLHSMLVWERVGRCEETKEDAGNEGRWGERKMIGVDGGDRNDLGRACGDE